MIDVYNTHIEVHPYNLGDSPSIEKSMSKYDISKHTYIPIAYYVEDETLYLPRGYNIAQLESIYHEVSTLHYKCDPFENVSNKFEPLLEAKSEMQQDGINFLISKDKFAYTSKFSQLGLNLDTGDGKTYATIYAIAKLGVKAIIITHQDKIKFQWKNSLLEKTNIKEDQIFDISNSSAIKEILDGNVNADIYLVNHQTLHSYARSHSWNDIHELFKTMKVGIKVFDEAHKFFENILMVDFFTDTGKNFYLTATFGRGDIYEYNIYKKAFSHTIRFGEETLDYVEKRKHTIFIIVYFASTPQNKCKEPYLRTKYGMSNYKYIDYELNRADGSLVRVLHTILDKIEPLEGKIAILSPKKDTVDFFANDVKEYTGKEVGTIYSDNSKEENEENKEKDIICSTIKSIGTGTDIDKLRVLINLEPVSGKNLADQVRGRLREYSSDKDTYLFYPVDTTLPDMINNVGRITRAMKKKCKKIIAIRL